MGKQGKTRKTENFGKGKVTPVQIAFIVDRYLSDNNYHQTRSVFRVEASSLISKSPVQEAPKTLLSLGAMLNEYISLKEQKVMMDQERARLEHEKCRVQTLLQGMQAVMNAYNASGSAPSPMIPCSSTNSIVTVPFGQSVIACPSYTTPTVVPLPVQPNNRGETENVSSSAAKKRKSSKNVSEAPSVSKRTRSKLDSGSLPSDGRDTGKQLVHAANCQENAQHASDTDSLPKLNVPSGSSKQGSSVAKCLFNQPVLSPPSNSSVPNTPPQGTSSPSDKCKSPLESSSPANCSNNCTPEEITPSHCTVISSQRVTVSPFKQGTYYSVERNQVFTSSPVKTSLTRTTKRDHVKGRLNFDGSDVLACSDKAPVEEVSTSESEKEADIFDMDFPSLDAFGPDFSFTELLVDLGLDYDGVNFCCQPMRDSSADNVSGSSHESGDNNIGANQFISELSSTLSGVRSEKELNSEGPDSVTEVKSVTRSICILSPAKGNRRPLDQENCS